MAKRRNAGSAQGGFATGFGADAWMGAGGAAGAGAGGFGGYGGAGVGAGAGAAAGWGGAAGAARVSPLYQTDTGRRRASRNGAVAFAAVIFAAFFAATVGAFYVAGAEVGLVALLVAAAVGCLAINSIHIVLEWEKAVVLRLGRFNRVAGPGVVFTIPIVEFYTLRVDQRVIATYFGAEETLTSDLVPVNVDAVLFWVVFSPKRATVEVEDYAAAVSWVAQTTMRKAIGRATVAQVAMRRDQLDEELRRAIGEKLNPWGIDIIDVEVRDIVIPKDLQEAMAAEAIAERKKNARMVLAEAERDISDMLADAAVNYAEAPEALKLRTMHLAYESVEESGGTVVIPSAFSEGFTADDARAAERAASR